ncbi:MAG: carboxypeptidase-like regulatory domain-containing protein, partial [Actinobacteria bacterium]|nr:carboxypeptidase-like regulatory domain-containing protein [Actinomycetota bacterium]
SGTVFEPDPELEAATSRHLLALETEPTGSVVFACPTGAEGEAVVCPGAEVALDDTYTITDLVPGSYDVFAMPPSSRTDLGVSATVVVELEGGADVTGVDLTFTLVTPELFSLAGTVYDHNEAPVTGATVEACSVSASTEAILIDEVRTGCPTVTTSEKGTFSFSLPSGDYVVEATFEGLSSSEAVTVPTEFALSLFLPEPTGSVAGTVEDFEGITVEGAAVQACADLADFCASDVSGADGSFFLDGLPLDSFTLLVQPPADRDELNSETKIFTVDADHLVIDIGVVVLPLADTTDPSFLGPATSREDQTLTDSLEVPDKPEPTRAPQHFGDLPDQPPPPRQPQHFGEAPQPQPPPPPPRQPQHFGSAPQPDPSPAAQSPPPPPRQAQAFGSSALTPAAQSPPSPPPREAQAFGSPPTPP